MPRKTCHNTAYVTALICQPISISRQQHKEKKKRKKKGKQGTLLPSIDSMSFINLLFYLVIKAAKKKM